MALPAVEDIHLALLKSIFNHRINSIKEAERMLVRTFELTDKEWKEKHKSGMREFFYRVALSTIKQIEAGLIFPRVTPYRTTETARQLLAKKPKQITNQDIDELIKQKRIKKEQREHELAQQLLLNKYDAYLQKIVERNKKDSRFFEYVSGLVLSKDLNVEFSKIEFTPPHNDGGIDGIIHLGESDKEKIYFESKCKQDNPIRPSFLRDFIGALVLRKANHGYYFTTTRYTGEAIDIVKELRDPDINININLIDGHKLVELIFKYGLENEIMRTGLN
ncbi:restriction endonuclease [Paenibacillus alvei]